MKIAAIAIFVGLAGVAGQGWVLNFTNTLTICLAFVFVTIAHVEETYGRLN